MTKPKSIACPNCGSPVPQETNLNQPFKCQACASILIMNSPAEATEAITCPNCQTVNGQFNRYCTRCQVRIQVDCPICYYSNPSDASVCFHCGANIGAEVKRRETWLEIKKQHDQRRKLILAQTAAEEQRNEILRLLADLDEPDRHSFAIFYLCKNGDAAVPLLIETLGNDSDPDARYGSARALGMIGNSLAIPPLMDALSDPEPAVRYYAIESLVALKAVESRSEIELLTEDPFQWVYKRAEKALIQLDGIV